MRKKVVRNAKATPKAKILDQMNEPRPLPMGLHAFEEWSHRILTGALIPNKDGRIFIDEITGLNVWDDESDYCQHINSLKFALAEMLMHLGPTESHKPDAYFIHALRMGAVKQVAYSFMQEMLAKKKAREAKEVKYEPIEETEHD